MSQFENVLIYAEANAPQSMERVIEIVSQHSKSLTVCDVIAPAPQLPDPDGTLDRLSKLSWQRALERLRDLCRPYMKRVRIDYTVLVGNPFVAITEQVIQQGFDLVVHISEPQTENDAVGLNPTGMHLMRKCPCAVWNMPAQPAELGNEIVLAIDRDLSTTDAHGESTVQELFAAAQFAAGMNAKIHVVHAWQPYGETLLADPAYGIPPEQARAYVDRMQEDYHQWFEQVFEIFQSSAPELNLVPHLVEGSPPEVLLDRIRETNARLCIIGTIGSSKVPGMLIGTTAEALLARSTAPVMTIKPRGFRTPLRFESDKSARRALA